MGRRTAVIFGGAGFIGSNWAAHLLKQGDASVHVFDNLSRRGVRANLEWLRQLAKATGKLSITVGDLRDAAAVERAAADATEVYHFAAQVAVTSSLTDPRHDFEVNGLGTFNILEAARKSGNNPFLLFTSTNKVYGEMARHELEVKGSRYGYRDLEGISEEQPLDFHSPYGCSKGAADQYVRDYARIYGIPTVVFRMSCIAGERQFGTEDQGWVAHFLYSALRRAPIVVYGDGRQVRDVLWVGDLLRAFEAVRIRLTLTAGQIYNVGGGSANAVSLLELIQLIEARTGERLAVRHEEPRPADQLVYITDHGKLTRDTGWRPRRSVTELLNGMEAFWESEINAPVTMPSEVLQKDDVPEALPRTA